jgi:hypothetical protein
MESARDSSSYRGGPVSQSLAFQRWVEGVSRGVVVLASLNEDTLPARVWQATE